MKKFLLLTLLIYSQIISAAIKIDVDLLRSPDHTKVWTPPSATTTLVGTNTTDDLSNKTLDKVNVTTEQVNTTATGANATLAAATSSMYKVTNVSLTSVDGITAPTTNLIITLQNKVGSAITLNNATGTAANQIITGTGANLSLANDASVIMQYSTTYSKWYVVGGSGSGGGGSISDWVTATAYVVGNYVNESNKIYKCISAHTSGTFATDLAASKWVEVSGPYNLTGPITSVGAATSIASQTGTGTKFVMDTSPTLVTPTLGVASATSINGTSIPSSKTLETKDTLTTKGDLYVATASATTARQAVGTNNQVLTADSGQTNGLKWADSQISTQGLSEGSSVSTTNLKAPYNQLTTISTGIRLLQTGNENMLVNPNFEGQNTSGVANGWTNVAGTATITTTASEISSGSQAQKIALSTQTLSFSQSVNTPSGIQKQGVVGGLYKVPSAVSSFQVCSTIDSAEQTCVPSTSLVLNDTYQWIEIPVTFGATNAGIKFKTTGNVTGNVFFDAAYVKQGIGLQNLMTDYIYTAKVSSAGVVSAENKDWINGNASVTNTSTYGITFNTGIFTVAPNCLTTVDLGSAAVISFDTSATTTGISPRGFNSTSGANQATPFILTCMKTGNDYLASSANVYSTASNPALVTDVFSALLSSSGVVSKENLDWINGNGSGLNPMTVTFNTGYFTVAPNCVATASGRIVSINSISSTTVSLNLLTIGGVSGVDQPIYLVCQKQGVDFTNSVKPVIVGSFQDVPVYEGTVRPKIYTFDMSATGVVSSEIGDLINGNCSLASNDFTCTFNSGKFTTAAQCFANVDRASDEGAFATVGSTTASGTIISTFNTAVAARAVHAFCIGY